ADYHIGMSNEIRFADGAAYERYMGTWSQLAGETFLGWLAPQPGLRWLDVGCGNGAFTEMLVEQCAPLAVDVIDPSAEQLAYAWDMFGGGFPYDALHAEMRAIGVAVPVPPSRDASRMDVMRELWTRAGLDGVGTREITVQRTFADFDNYWTTVLGGPSVGPQLAALSSEDRARLTT